METTEKRIYAEPTLEKREELVEVVEGLLQPISAIEK